MTRADKFLLVIEKTSSPYQIFYYYEYIALNEKHQLRVERSENSCCLKLYVIANNEVFVEASEKQRFDWFDEKYLLASSFDVYDKACELNLPKPFLNWIAARL
ncbi:MAG: hypothetical protein AB8G05_27215 [Oligoflexales bacterium]